MSSARTARPLLLLLLIAWLWPGPPVAADPWYEHYEKAEAALASGDWTAAVEQLQEALQRRGDSGTRVRTYGMRTTDYFPYLKLGVAYHQLGRHQAALEAFATEERLGAASASPAASAELTRYRTLAEAARDRQRQAEQDRLAETVEEALAAARALAAEGRLDDAMAALAPALAAAPDDAAALALMSDLRRRAVAEQERLRLAQQSAEALGRGKRLLAGGDPEGAAALLRQALDDAALDAAASAEARRLLTEAQTAIAESAAGRRREQEVADALVAARSAWREGRAEVALDRLERVFALAPADGDALALRQEIVAARDAASQSALVISTLAEAERLLAAGRWEHALAAANRVLALDPGRTEALATVQRAYAEISARLLSAGRGENLPPAIRFGDRREERDGRAVELLRSPRAELSGVVIDRTPVTLTLLEAAGPESAAEPRPVEATSHAIGDFVVTEFRLRPRLAPGTTTFRLEATDPEGLSSSSEYAILYQPAWFRSPWLPAAALLLVAAALGLWLGMRRRRRLRRLARRFNPYIAGGPVFDERLFFGREPLLQRVLETLHNNSLMLYGERRIGKTTLLHQLRRRLDALDDPDYRFLTVYVDLQGTPESHFFALLADSLHEALPAELQDEDRTPGLASAAGYDHHDLVRELHGWIRALRAETDKHVKVVLLIDEVDELNHYDPRINQKLRSLFMKSFAESLVAVVAGVRIRKEWEKEASPWYNFFEEIPVEEIDPHEARRLVEDPIRGTFKLAPGVAQRIVEQTGGKPYLIQRRCLALVSRLHEEGRRTLTLADCEAVE